MINRCHRNVTPTYLKHKYQFQGKPKHNVNDREMNKLCIKLNTTFNYCLWGMPILGITFTRPLHQISVMFFCHDITIFIELNLEKGMLMIFTLYFVYGCIYDLWQVEVCDAVMCTLPSFGTNPFRRNTILAHSRSTYTNIAITLFF